VPAALYRSLDMALLTAAVVLTVLAIAMPSSLGSLWPAGPRLFPFALILLVVGLPWKKVSRWVTLVLSTTLLVGLSTASTLHAVSLDQEFRDFLGGVAVVDTGKNILPILADPNEGSRWTDPYRNLVGYYTIERGGANPYVFAEPHIKTAASPLKFRRTEDRLYAYLYDPEHSAEDYVGVSGSYDYVLIWGNLPKIENVIHREMHVVYTRGRASLYKKTVDKTSITPGGPRR
jgi:hypothetical protein